MSEQDKNNVQAENTAVKEKSDAASQSAPQSTESSQDKPQKSAKSAKGGKKSAAAARKEQSRLKKEWEESIVASKKVKQEEIRRKVKRAMLIMLVFSLIVTSIVYVMLLFIQENDIRITATNRNKEKSISLSMDNSFWTPYLNADGPDQMWNVSYDPRYTFVTEKIDSIAQVVELLEADKIELGTLNGEQYIRFTFMLKNTGNEQAHINYEMTLEFDKHALHDAIRVMWGQSFRNESSDLETNTTVDVYAALSKNERLAGSNINAKGDGTFRTAEEGYIEYVSYSGAFTKDVNKGDPYYYVKDFENSLSDTEQRAEERKNGFFATTPFYSDEYVFQREADMDRGDIMYCYVSIWLEGSDFECIDDRLGGYCKLGLNFYAS